MESGCDREEANQTWICTLPQGNLTVAMLDSRTTLRYPVDLPARLTVGETELSGRIRNLSLGGIYVVGPALPVGTRVRVRFRALYVVEAFDHRCITRWTTTDGCGLSFEGMQTMDTFQLAHFIRSASRASQRIPTDAILRRPAR